ncbi:MAG: hypothetical protein H6710_21210 [Myxococcales bacterium]|nr:hypothetical protein [Myxococcales bacterium]
MEVIGWGKIIGIAMAVGLGVGFAFALLREHVWPELGGTPVVGATVGVVIGLLVARRKKALAAQAAASGGPPR